MSSISRLKSIRDALGSNNPDPSTNPSPLSCTNAHIRKCEFRFHSHPSTSPCGSWYTNALTKLLKHLLFILNTHHFGTLLLRAQLHLQVQVPIRSPLCYLVLLHFQNADTDTLTSLSYFVCCCCCCCCCCCFTRLKRPSTPSCGSTSTPKSRWPGCTASSRTTTPLGLATWTRSSSTPK